MAKTPNTVLADINEIYVGYVLFGNKWYDADAKAQFNQRVGQAQPDEVEDAIGKAEAMAKEFLVWAKQNGFTTPIKKVWWTARPNSMSVAVGEPVDQRKNPTDVLIKFSSGPANGFLGLSAKATKGKGDIGFKNPGIGTVDNSLKTKFADMYKKELEKTIKAFKLPESASSRKQYIRSNSGIKKQTETIGIKMMQKMRDEMLKVLSKKTQKELIDYLLQDWMDAELLYPPYIKVTGQGNKPPYAAAVMDPVKNPKLEAMNTKKITLQKIGNESIGVMAGTKKIMKMRFKFESEKMASSLKMSGDPW